MTQFPHPTAITVRTTRRRTKSEIFLLYSIVISLEFTRQTHCYIICLVLTYNQFLSNINGIKKLAYFLPFNPPITNRFKYDYTILKI